ncbi:MAG: 4a-hydroxytetrahydrobiopterin dehydratase [Anaerolineae bacterium]|nr:4a-hydroxytetrahydrobiopterin dehydratase [Anaerolineae bacterium]
MARTPLSDTDIATALESLDGWKRKDNKLVKTFHPSTYSQGLVFATAAGMIADSFDHHPDMLIGYKKVTLEFTTHDAGNSITQMDVDVATAINALKIRL